MLRKMMMHATLLAMLPMAALAGDAATVAGGDRYESGTNVSIDEALGRDGLLSGFSVSVRAKVEKDVHAIGAYVDIAGPVGQDVYAGGMTVKVSNSIGEDLTAAGGNLQIAKTAVIAGNARLTGANVVVDGTIDGALIAAAGHLEVNGTVKGDAYLTAGELVFGPDAKIMGTLSYSAPATVDIPESVVPPARIKYVQLKASSAVDKAQDAARDYTRRMHFGEDVVSYGFVPGVIFLFLLGGALLWLAPDLSAGLVADALAMPVKSIIAGMVGLAIIIGLIPISLMTIFGIPLAPFLLLLAIIVWIGGYLLGVYAAATRVARAFGQDGETLGRQLIILGLGLVVFAILNFIPFAGWLINLAAVFLGIGVVATRCIDRFARWNAPPQIRI